MKNKLEYVNEVHNQAIGWTGNCDSKASFILAFVGIIIPLILTSDYIIGSLEKLLSDFIGYWINEKGEFSLIALFMFVSLCTTIFFVGKCVVCQINCLTARLNENTASIIFFKSISEQNYEDYVALVDTKTDDEYLQDKLKQIHICSTICTAKFQKYNKGVKAIKVGLLFFALFVVFTVIFNA